MSRQYCIDTGRRAGGVVLGEICPWDRVAGQTRSPTQIILFAMAAKGLYQIG